MANEETISMDTIDELLSRSIDTCLEVLSDQEVFYDLNESSSFLDYLDWDKG